MTEESRYIICANPLCNKMLKVSGIPKECPNCHQPFNKHSENETITDVIYNIITGKSEKGYMDCSPQGWVKGEELLMPNERRLNLGE
jgi:hypothetical protein